MRPKWFAAFSQMLPRLQAEEALAEREVIAAGTGSLAENDQRSYLRNLQQAASGGRRPASVKATVAGLAGMHIPVQTLDDQGKEVKPRGRATRRGSSRSRRRPAPARSRAGSG